MKLLEKLHHPEKYGKTLLKWSLLGALMGLFCCVTNSPIASIFLSIEMFGGANVYLFAFVCVIAFVISGNWSLYGSQLIQFSKSRFVKRKFEQN